RRPAFRPTAPPAPAPSGAKAPPRRSGILLVGIGAVLAAALVGALLATRRPKPSTAPPPPAPTRPAPVVDERARLLEDARRLEAEGKLDEALSSYRDLARRDPSSREAVDAVARLEAGPPARAGGEAETQGSGR